MKKLFRSAAIGVALAATAFTGVATASAATPPPPSPDVTPYIVGGTQAPETPWAVQLVFDQPGGTFGCTGEAISSQWVLTAQHCVDQSSNMRVYFSNSTSNRGTAIKGDKLLGSPNGDVALVHLATPKNLSSYPAVAQSYTPTPGAAGQILGYGLRANQVQPDGLYQANVSVLGASTDAYYGDAVHVKGSNGASNHGDSGGPLFVGGKIVGVCSTGDSADPGANIHAGSNYANVTGSRAWITQNTGV